MISDVATAAYYAFAAGFAVATWRRDKRLRDAWWCAFGLLTITAITAIVTPDPDIPGRAGSAVTIWLWAYLVIHYWSKSGIPCRVHGHTWMVSVNTPGGAHMQMSLPADPAAEAEAFAKFAPRLLGQGWADTAIITRTCAVCDKAHEPDPNPPAMETIP